MWTEIPKGNKGKKAHATNKERFIPKMFLRGDSVIYILRNPKWYSIEIIKTAMRY